MKLGELIKKFSHNNVIRLHHKIKGGHICVGDKWNDTSMDWEVNKQQGIFRHYINNEVIKLIGIVSNDEYGDIINIVIEKLDNQVYLEDLKEEDNGIKHCEAL